MRHLSEEEIQAYLDGDGVTDAARVADHLRECAACRKMCEEYGMLYAALADESHVSAPALEGGERAAADRADAVVGAWAMTAALAVAAGVFVRIGGFGPDASRVAGAFSQLFRRVVELPVPLWRTLVGVNHETGAAAIAVVALLAASGALALDYLLIEPRLRSRTP